MPERTDPMSSGVFRPGQLVGNRFSILTMEFLSGENLAERIKRTGPLSMADALPLMQQMCAGLRAAHEAKVIHGDLKSSNVMLIESPEDPVRVVLTDFDLARSLTCIESTITMGLIRGTPLYMAPEQRSGMPISAATDIYSLGVVFYNMLTARLPFENESEMHQAPTSPRRHVPELPAPCESLILRCLDRDPGKRFVSSDEMLEPVQRLPQTDSLRSNWYFLRTATGTSRRILLGAGLASGAALIAFLGWRFSITGVGSSPRVNAIAVLPFLNGTGDPNLDYLCDGISDHVTNTLSGLQAITVRPRSAVLQYKGTLSDLHTVGKHLRVGSVVIGRLSKTGDTVTVSAELINLDENRQLWGNRYRRNLNDLIAVEHEIASDVAVKLRLWADRKELANLSNPPTASVVFHK